MTRKRQRVADDDDKGDDMAEAIGTSLDLAKSLGEAGNTVWTTMNRHLDDTNRELKSYRSLAHKLGEEVIVKSVEKSQSELSCLSLARDLSHSTATVERMSQYLQKCTADAVNSVTNYMNDAATETIRVLEDQVMAERSEKEVLLEKVSQTISSSCTLLDQTNERLLMSKVKVLKSNLSVCQLQAKYDAEVERHRQSAKEMTLLMKMTRALAERSKNMERTNKELQRTKAYVYSLEKKLGLKGVVEAVGGDYAATWRRGADSSNPQVSASFGSPAVPFGDISLDVRSIKSDASISDVVHSWCEQQLRLKEAAARESRLNEMFAHLQRQVLTVHHQFLEEKQRREMYERRLSDVARQRLHPNADVAVVEEMKALRQKLCDALDDKAELKVLLCVAKTELSEARRTVTELNKKIAQMSQDREGDHVAQTLEELREFYLSRLDQFQQFQESYEAQRLILMLHSDECNALVEKFTQDITERESLHTLPNWENSTQNTFSTTACNLYTEAKEKLARLDEVTKSVRKTCMTNTALEVKNGDALSDIAMATTLLKDTSLRIAELLNAKKEEESSAQLRVSSKDTADAQVGESTLLMEQVISEALQFVLSHLQKSDCEKSILLDRSRDDGQRVDSLTSTMSVLSHENLYLKKKLEQMTQVIERNHLTILERATMEKISVEESIDVAETKEQLSTVQEKLSAVTQSFEVAQADLLRQHRRIEELEDEIQRSHASQELERQQISELKTMLLLSKQSERNALLRLAESESRATCTLECSGESGSDKHNEVDSLLLDASLRDLGKHLSNVVAAMERSLAEAAVDRCEREAGDAELLRKGYHHVVTSLREVCAELQQLKTEGLNAKMQVNEEVLQVGAESQIVTPEIKILELERALREQSRKSTDEQNALTHTIQELMAKIEKMNLREQRLLALCKKSMEQQKVKAVSRGEQQVEQENEAENTQSIQKGDATNISETPLSTAPPTASTLQASEVSVSPSTLCTESQLPAVTSSVQQSSTPEPESAASGNPN